MKPNSQETKIRRYGKKWGKKIIQHLQKNNKTYYRRKYIQHEILLEPWQITIGTMWLEQNNYVTLYSCRSRGVWEYTGGTP